MPARSPQGAAEREQRRLLTPIVPRAPDAALSPFEHRGVSLVCRRGRPHPTVHERISAGGVTVAAAVPVTFAIAVSDPRADAAAADAHTDRSPARAAYLSTPLQDVRTGERFTLEARRAA